MYLGNIMQISRYFQHEYAWLVNGDQAEPNKSHFFGKLYAVDQKNQ
jgi:hypothetical protein